VNDRKCKNCGKEILDFDDGMSPPSCTECDHDVTDRGVYESIEGWSDEKEASEEEEMVRIRKIEDEETRKKLSSARNPRKVPPPEKGSSSSGKLLDRIRERRERGSRTPGGSDSWGEPVIGFGQSYDDHGGWIAGEHEESSGSTGAVFKAAEVDANREAASFLGLGGKEEGRTDAILSAERVCPPFQRPMGPLRNHSLIREGIVGDRLQIDQVIGSIFMSKFGGVVGRSRPMRQTDDGWSSNNSDWVLWELYSQLSLRMGKPWFLGRWANTVGLNTRKLHNIMPCSGECLHDIKKGPNESLLGPHSMAELLEAFEGISIDDSVSEIAGHILEDLGDELSDLASITLHSEGQPVQFRHGIHLVSNRDEQGTFDGSEWWDESDPEEFRMWHISVALCLLQAMFDERLDHHHDGAYQKVRGFLQDEVDRFTGSTWNDLKASWDEIFVKSTGRDPFE